LKILLTGASGYIGKRLLPVLVDQGHEIICCVRDKQRFDIAKAFGENVSVFEVDFLEEVEILKAPIEFDVAFYLIHSMSSSISNFEDLEAKSAENFVKVYRPDKMQTDHISQRNLQREEAFKASYVPQAGRRNS